MFWYYCARFAQASSNLVVKYYKNLDFIKNIPEHLTEWKVSKYGVFSGPYFLYSDWIQEVAGSKLKINK